MSKPRLTVLQVIPAMQSGGAELGALQVAEALVAEGHRSLVVSEGGRMVPELERAGSQHIELPVASKNPFVLRRNAHRLAEIIRKEKVDLIHARSRAPAWSCHWASRWTQVPFVTTYHSGYSEDNILKHYYNRVMVKSDRVIAVSDWIADIIIKRYRTDPTKIAVIHRAVDPEVFDPEAVGEDRKTALRAAWGIGPNVPVVLLPGRLARRKGQDNLVKAIARIRNEVEPFVCILAGEDQGKTGFREQVESLVKKLGVGDIVKLVGHVDDMPAAYALAKISISAATAPEGFQRGMLEAQAMASPVLVSDVGPGVEVVLSHPRYDHDRTTGQNFDGLSVDDLAYHLKRMLEMPESDLRAMGRRGSRWVRQEYTRQRLTRATLGLYEELVSSAPARATSTVVPMHGVRRKDRDNRSRGSPTVLQIVPRLDSGGAEQTTVDIAAALVDAGGRALVASEGGRLVADLVEHGVEWIRFPAASKNPFRILHNAFQLRKMYADEGIDLIHARSRAPAWSALLSVSGTGVPMVTTYHGAYNEENAAKRFYNSVMARSSAIIANSRYTADLVMNRHKPDPERLHIVPRGIDLSAFDRTRITEERLTELRRAWRLTGTEKIVLLPARMTGWKGHSVLIDAAAILIAQGLDDLVVVLAGDAQGRLSYLDFLRTKIAAMGLDSTVRIVGHCSDMPAAFALADVAVVTSIEPEAFGRTAVEAQAMGCPVVVSNTGATPETVLAPPNVPDAERTGWRVPVGSPVHLAQALTDVFAMSADEAAAMAARAHLHVSDKFSVEAMAMATLDIYDAALGSDLKDRFVAARVGDNSGRSEVPLPATARSG